MCDLEYDEVSTIWSVTRPKARKTYTCLCCRAPICVGDVYFKVFSVYDGDATTERACAACDATMDLFGKEHRYYPAPSAFIEYLSECAQFDDAAALRWGSLLTEITTRRKAHNPRNA